MTTILRSGLIQTCGRFETSRSFNFCFVGMMQVSNVVVDGKRIVFDLLGDLYLLPIAGGEAKALTHSIAWEMQARFSPDGKRLAFTTYRSLSQLPEVRELVDVEVRRVNKLFARVENIRKFLILEKELDHDDGELTATQKVRRSIIGKKFAREIEVIYGGGTG